MRMYRCNQGTSLNAAALLRATMSCREGGLTCHDAPEALNKVCGSLGYVLLAICPVQVAAQPVQFLHQEWR